MNKVRIYELSKQLKVSNKEVMDFLLEKLKISVKSHSSSIDEDAAEKVIAALSKKKPEEKPTSPKPEEKPAQKKPEAQKQEKSYIAKQTPPVKPSEKIKEKTRQAPSQKPLPKPEEDEEDDDDLYSEYSAAWTGGQRKRKGKITFKPDTISASFKVKRSGGTSTIGERIEKIDKTAIFEKPGIQTRVFPRPKDFKKGKKSGGQKAPEVTMKTSMQKWIALPEMITVGELAQKLEVQPSEIIKNLVKQGIMAGINQLINFEFAAQFAKQLGFKIEKEKLPEKEKEVEEDPGTLVIRPPVVTVLGHVDHGKTSLLDAIRNTNVTASESGGITQNIGAYTVHIKDRDIVFIDTPGHEAFTAMRARGAQVTDIAVLVVAADDGVMPQTIEAINHAKAAGVPIIVAINKIDKADSNPEKVKQQLTEYDLIPEDWGGDTVMVAVSAKTKVGIEELLEMILLVADIHEFKANPDKPATGTIIESKLDKGFGPVATVIVQSGTLKVGDPVIVGNEFGRVRFMINDKGKRIKKVPPSYPAEIIGLSGVPEAGSSLQVIEDEKIAKDIAEARKLQLRTDQMQASTRVSLDDLFKQLKEGETKDLNIIIKADVKGSLEALRHSLQRLSNNEVRISVIHGGIGTITESDVMLAKASNAIIIGFNVRPDPNTKRLADQEKVDIRLYRVIYNVIEDVKAAMTGLLEPEYREMFLGRAEVRAIFKISRIGIIAGSYVLEGKLTRNATVRVMRDGVVIYDGKIDSLRRFKDDVKEVAAGFECGIFIEKFPGFQPGDIVEAYTFQEIKRELSQPVAQQDE